MTLWLLVVRENLSQRVATIKALKIQLDNQPPSSEMAVIEARLAQALRAYNQVLRSGPARIPARVFGFGEING